MYAITKSALFMRQWRIYTQDYRDRAGVPIAERFIDAVEHAVRFIGQSPYACPVYDIGEGYEDLRTYQFRKWNLDGFPHLVLFRVGANTTIFIELLYAHKMDIPSRLDSDLATQHN